MPKVDDTVQVTLVMRGESRPFWQTSAVIGSVSAGVVVIDGFDRPVAVVQSDLTPAGDGRWNLAWEVRA